MIKERTKRTVYYEDEARDDFMDLDIKRCTVDGSFPYIHKNPLWRLVSFLLYYGVAVPLVWTLVRVFWRVRFVNKRAIKKCKGQRCFLYGNHTGVWDAFIPNLIGLPHRGRIVVGAETVSIKGLKNITQMLGAMPLPTGLDGMRAFSRAIDHHHKTSHITIYPEAHIWPYYTGVRQFSDASFAYPVKCNAPVIAFFTAFEEPRGLFKHFRKANMTVYVSDPIYPAEGLTGREARRDLCEQVYAFMQAHTKYSTYEAVEYVHRDGDDTPLDTASGL